MIFGKFGCLWGGMLRGFMEGGARPRGSPGPGSAEGGGGCAGGTERDPPSLPARFFLVVFFFGG